MERGGGERRKGETGVQRRVRNILVEEMYCNNNNTQKKEVQCCYYYILTWCCQTRALRHGPTGAVW